MGACRGSGGDAGQSPLERSLEAYAAPIDPAKTGASFRALSARLRYGIEANLRPDATFLEYARAGRKLQREWSTRSQVSGRKIRILSEVEDGVVTHTVKEKNKVLLKTTDKNRVANKVAEFYQQEDRALERERKKRRS